MGAPAAAVGANCNVGLLPVDEEENPAPTDVVFGVSPEADAEALALVGEPPPEVARSSMCAFLS